MAFLGMLMLGIFVGWVVSFGVFRVRSWVHFGTLVTSAISAAVAGGVFTFIKFLGRDQALGNAIYMYPVGLTYGVLCNGMQFIGLQGPINSLRWLFILAFIIATALLLALLIWPGFRDLLPH